jgi:prepilin-type processing-associated H-X9-DG protein
MKDAKRAPRWFSLGGMFTLFMLMVSGLILLLQFAEFAPSKPSCRSNLLDIYWGLRTYVSGYGEKQGYPPHVGTDVWLCLIGRCGDKNQHPDTYFEDAPLYECDDVFICPETRKLEYSFDYLGPRKRTPEGNPCALMEGLPPDTPVAADKKGNHPDGGNVLFFDGSIKFLQGEEYEKAMKELE